MRKEVVEISICARRQTHQDEQSVPYRGRKRQEVYTEQERLRRSTRQA